MSVGGSILYKSNAGTNTGETVALYGKSRDQVIEIITEFKRRRRPMKPSDIEAMTRIPYRKVIHLLNRLTNDLDQITKLSHGVYILTELLGEEDVRRSVHHYTRVGDESNDYINKSGFYGYGDHDLDDLEDIVDEYQQNDRAQMLRIRIIVELMDLEEGIP